MKGYDPASACKNIIIPRGFTQVVLVYKLCLAREHAAH